MSWPLVKLGDVAPAKAVKHYFSPDDLVWQLNLDQVESQSGRVINKLIAPYSETGSSTHGFDDTHVLYSKLRPYLNKVVLPDSTGMATTELVPLKPDPKRLDRKYLVYYLRSKKFVDWISAQVAGAKMPRVSMKLFWEHEIPLPPLKEQKRIAAILDKADAIRRKRQQAIKLADDFLRSVFLDMFGDPVTNPKGWEVKPLIELCDNKMQNGAYYPKEEYSEDGVEMVHMSDAFYDTVQRGSLKRVKCSQSDINKYALDENNILISRRSLTYEGAAKPSLIPKSSAPLIFESSLIRVTPSKKKVLARFLFQYLSSEEVKEQHIRKYVTGATIKGISQKNLEKVMVYVPPLNMQAKFIEMVNRISKVSEKVMLSESLIAISSQALSQKTFSGKL